MPDPRLVNTEVQLAVTRIKNGIQRKLGFNDNNCYAAPTPSYVEGQDQRVIQIVIGRQDLEGEGHGGQEGGNLHRRNYFSLVLWYRVNLDQHGTTPQGLVQASEGLIDFIESVRGLFDMTWLGDENSIAPVVTMERVQYEGRSQPIFYDTDEGVIRTDIEISTALDHALPRTITLAAADCI